jgi:putative pyruvate formate lyase activating enzyme
LLRAGVLQQRVEELERLLARCTVCPRDCLNNRLNNDIAACYSGRLPIVSSYTAHFGEEPPLSGTRGAGNIFFGNCNLRCVYCQNYQISQTHKQQLKNEVTHERLAEMMLESQHQLRFANTLRAANGAFDPARGAEWFACADRLQHECLRRCAGVAVTRSRSRCLLA